MQDVQCETASLGEAVTELRLMIRQVQYDANEDEQYSRLSNLQIPGLPVPRTRV